MKVFTIMTLGLVTTLVTVTQNGCHRDLVGGLLKASVHRVVTISLVTAGDPSACEVNYPVTLLRASKKHTMDWAAADHDYWLYFPNGNPFGLANTISIANGKETGPLPITISPASPIYFKYAIYSQDPGSGPNPIGNPCKNADDDRDTGLNVKK